MFLELLEGKNDLANSLLETLKKMNKDNDWAK